MSERYAVCGRHLLLVVLLVLFAQMLGACLAHQLHVGAEHFAFEAVHHFGAIRSKTDNARFAALEHDVVGVQVGDRGRTGEAGGGHNVGRRGGEHAARLAGQFGEHDLIDVHLPIIVVDVQEATAVLGGGEDVGARTALPAHLFESAQRSVDTNGAVAFVDLVGVTRTDFGEQRHLIGDGRLVLILELLKPSIEKSTPKGTAEHRLTHEVNSHFISR